MNRKSQFLSTVLFFSVLAAHAQSVTNGYYVTLEKKDTIAAQILLKKGVFGKSLDNLIKEVEVAEGESGEKLFKPTDINSFGFSHEGKKYRYVAKPTKDGSYKFLNPLAEGPHASLYQHGFFMAGNGSAMASKQIFYTFERPDRPAQQYLFLKNMVNKNFKLQLKTFFSDRPDLVELIDARFKYWLELDKDLLALMNAANKN